MLFIIVSLKKEYRVNFIYLYQNATDIKTVSFRERYHHKKALYQRFAQFLT